jgi:hypothetical protein
MLLGRYSFKNPSWAFGEGVLDTVHACGNAEIGAASLCVKTASGARIVCNCSMAGCGDFRTWKYALRYSSPGEALAGKSSSRPT